MSGFGSIAGKSLIQHLRPAAGAGAIAKTETVAAPKALSRAEAKAQQRFKALQETNAMVVLKADPKALMAMFSTGKLEKGKLFLHNVNESTQQEHGIVALVLSDEGKKALATSSSIDRRLNNRGAGFGMSTDLPVPLDLHRHVQEVVVDDLANPALVKAFEEAAAQGAIPKMIGGKPSAQLFKPSDDFFNDFQVEQFRKDVPGFAQKPLIEQKAIAALAGAVARQFPDSIPGVTCHRVAAAMVTHKAYDTPLKTEGLDVVGEVRNFFHGRQIIGRDGEPLRAPETLLDEGFHPDEKGHYGIGVYHANASVAQGYGLISLDKPGAILSGKVAVGQMASTNSSKLEFDTTPSIQSFRSAVRAFGDYWVTKDPARFAITGITRYDPAATDFARVIPDLLKSVPHAPEWAIPKLLALDPSQLQRALDHVGKSGDPALKHSITLVQASRGDEHARAEALKLLKSSDGTLKAASVKVMKSVVLDLGSERIAEAQAVVQAMFKSTPALAKDPEFIADLAIRYGGEIFGGAKLEVASEALWTATIRDTSATEAVVKGLIAAGAELQPRENLRTAIHNAAQKGNTSAIKAMLEAGFDPLAKDANGDMALHLAAADGHVEVVKMLLPLVPDVNARNAVLKTPLHFMARSGNVDGVNALLAAGADVNAQAYLLLTPLHLAAGRDHRGAVSALIKAGADIGAKLKDGRSALDVARQGNKQEAIQAFAEAGVLS